MEDFYKCGTCGNPGMAQCDCDALSLTFCPGCRTPLHNEGMFCVDCSYDDEPTFCLRCGDFLASNVPPEEYDDEGEVRKCFVCYRCAMK